MRTIDMEWQVHNDKLSNEFERSFYKIKKKIARNILNLMFFFKVSIKNLNHFQSYSNISSKSITCVSLPQASE